MATRVSRGRICLTSFNSTIAKTPNREKKASISVIFPTQAELQPISSQMSLPWQPRSVVVVFVWHYSIALPRKPRVGCKDLLNISYTSRVIVDFVSNFVAMATGVGRGKICLASFYSPAPKTPCYTQRSRKYLLYRPSNGRFCPKFRCHGNGGWSW